MIVLSNIEHVQTRQILSSSSTFREAFSLPGALPRTFDYEGVAGDDIADHLVRLLDDDRVRSLGKERVLELMGDEKNRLCQYACGRNFEVLKWANNELDLPWAPCLAGRVSDDFLVLRVLRETWPQLKEWWLMDIGPEDWDGVTMDNGQVVKLRLHMGLGGAVPAEVGRLSALTVLDLGYSRLATLTMEQFYIYRNRLTSLPAEIGQLTALRELNLEGNPLTSVPAEIGQLTSLRELNLNGNELTSLPAEIGQLTSLTDLYLRENQLTSVPAATRELRAAGCYVQLDDGVRVDE